MLLRICRRAMARQRGKTLMAVLAVLAGSALTTALLSIALDITDKMGRELRAFGANILVGPKRAAVPVEIGGIRYGTLSEPAYLDEGDLPSLKTIFWRHNIVGFAPFLTGTARTGGREVTLVGTWFDRSVTVPATNRKIVVQGRTVREVPVGGSTFRTGLRTVAPWWQVEGRWVNEKSRDGEAMVGRGLAQGLGLRVGDRLPLAAGRERAPVTVVGIVTTGGAEENQLFVDLDLAQRLFGLPDRVERIQVSALVKPDDALARRAQRAGPKALPPDDFVTWYCSPYMDAILYQIEEAIPAASARPIRQVAEAEGGFLSRMALTLTVVTVVALVVAGLGVGAVMSAQVLERRAEIALMRAIGADQVQIGLQFLFQAGAVGALGGAAGVVLGLGFGRLIGVWVFGTAITLTWTAPLAAVTIALAVSIIGAAGPVRQAMGVQPVTGLRSGRP